MELPCLWRAATWRWWISGNTALRWAAPTAASASAAKTCGGAFDDVAYWEVAEPDLGGSVSHYLLAGWWSYPVFRMSERREVVLLLWIGVELVFWILHGRHIDMKFTLQQYGLKQKASKLDERGEMHETRRILWGRSAEGLDTLSIIEVA